MYSEMILLGVICFLIGWVMSSSYSDYRLRKYVEHHLGINGKEPHVEKVQIKVEEHDNTLFAYRVDNNMFLGQSKTGEELVQQLKERFSNQTVNIVIHEDDGAHYIREFF
jgi:hypothetical protein